MTAAPDLRQLFKPVGKVALRFGVSTAVLAAIMGPVGGGKTTEAIAKIVRIGGMQEAVWNEKRGCFVKKCRGAVVRDTYPNLDRTVIKSWLRWFPKDMKGAHWSGEAPRTHTFTLGMGGLPGSPGYYEVDHEVIFVAIGDHAVEDVLRGLELTWLWLNEIDLLPRAIVEVGIGRIGRYPSGDLGRCLFPQIIADFNAPEEDNWTVAMIVEKKLDPDAVKAFEARLSGEGAMKRELIGFYRQPGGLEENAENLHNLEGGRAYYEVQAAFLPPDKKRRFIDNRIGPLRHGTPVFPEFCDDFLYDAQAHGSGHVRQFAPLAGQPILIGADQGLLGAVVIAQLNPMTDQLMVLDEMARVFEGDDGHIEVSQIGGEAFGREVAARLATRYGDLPVGLVVCDPAGTAGEQAISHSSWRKDFAKGLGLNVVKAPVPGNAIEPRLKAVRDRLGAKLPGKPRLIIHPRCTILRKAFNSKYVLQRVSVGAVDSGRFGDKPVKSQGYSDVMDALQYLAFSIDRGLNFRAVGSAPPRAQRAPIANDSGYDPFAHSSGGMT